MLTEELDDCIANEEIDVDFSASDLKRIAKEAIAEKESFDAEGVEIQMGADDVLLLVKEAAELMMIAAQEGNMKVSYPLPENSSDTLLKKVSHELKRIYPSVMIIMCLGKKEIVLDWSGNNEC